MKVKLLFDVREKGIQKLRRGQRRFSNVVGVMDKGGIMTVFVEGK